MAEIHHAASCRLCRAPHPWELGFMGAEALRPKRCHNPCRDHPCTDWLGDSQGQFYGASRNKVLPWHSWQVETISGAWQSASAGTSKNDLTIQVLADCSKSDRSCWTVTVSICSKVAKCVHDHNIFLAHCL